MIYKNLIIKCYAKQTRNVWVALCLNYNLATQADTSEEAKTKLEEQIVSYVDEALQDKIYGQQLLQRKAPISNWIEYYIIKFLMFFKN